MRALAREQDKLLSGVLAFAVHVLFVAFLIFSLRWQSKQPDTIEVQLWNALPTVKEVIEVKPKLIEHEQVRPRAIEEPVPEPSKEIQKPDILIKEKIEKDYKKEEILKKERIKREQEKSRLEELKQAKEKEELGAAQRQQDDVRRQQQEQAAAAQTQIRSEYVTRIQGKIRRFVVLPADIAGNPQAEFDVVLLPGGDVLSAKLKKSSGYAAYDDAVERAIKKAQPLPLPPDPTLFPSFRELHLKFRPEN